MAEAEPSDLRRPRPEIRTLPSLWHYIVRQWAEFFARFGGVITLNRKAFVLDFDDAADRQRSWEFWGFAWLLIALAERIVFGAGGLGDGLRSDAIAQDFLQRVVLEALWMLPFYLILNFGTPAKLSFFEFWLNCGPVIATLVLVERIVELSFWYALNPELVATHTELCPGATSVIPVLQTGCLNELAALGVNTGAAQIAHAAVWSGLMVFTLVVLWRYTIVAQREAPGPAALRVLTVQTALWGVAAYFYVRGLG